MNYINNAKEASDLNEMLFWMKTSKNKEEVLNKYQEAVSTEHYWYSFKTDQTLLQLKNELIESL